MTRTSPNHALQRTGSAVTAPAADHRRLSTPRQVPRPLRLSLSLGSFGVIAMRTLLTTFLLALFCASPVLAVPPSDAEATRTLLGEWVSAKKPGLIAGAMAFKPDGTFSCQATFMTPDGPLTIKVEGKWRVERGILIEELTRSSHPNLAPVGLATSDTLVSVTKDEYRFRTESGKEDSYSRKADDSKPTSPK